MNSILLLKFTSSTLILTLHKTSILLVPVIYVGNFYFFQKEMKVIQERNVERIAVQKDHQKAIDNLRKEHKKELDVSVQLESWKF